MIEHPGIRDCDFLICVGSKDNYINTISIKYKEQNYVMIHNINGRYRITKIDSTEPDGAVCYIKIVLRQLLYNINNNVIKDITIYLVTLDGMAPIDLSNLSEHMTAEKATINRTAIEKREALIEESVGIVYDWLRLIKTPYVCDTGCMVEGYTHGL